LGCTLTSAAAFAQKVDADGDGYEAGWDCNDNDPKIFPGGNETTCNGVDNDCDGSIDEAYKAPWTTCGVGACGSFGKLTCSGGQLVDTCVPKAPTTNVDLTCNNIDDDCDGTVDEDYVQTSVTCGQGPCVNTGYTWCDTGGKVRTVCTPLPTQGLDTTCNGVDEDCDGTADDEYNGTWTQCGIGECATWSKAQCINGTVVAGCTPKTPPSTTDATCDNKDNDCDGQTDEDVPKTPVTCGQGLCQNSGFKVCSKGNIITQCSPLPPENSDDNCDNIDNDCDGLTDEAYKAPWTYCGFGGCENYGKLACVNGELVDNCVPKTPTATIDDTCNKKDDDCDGEVDEEFVEEPITCGLGACANTGAKECVDGTVKNVCYPLAGAEDNDCDGVDDDCDGQIDEHFVGPFTSCGSGACVAQKRDICVNGVQTVVCVPSEPKVSTDPTCNNYDDDCDGETDEDYQPLPVTCGSGPCQQTGQTACVNGAVVEQCTPGSPENPDDNCDGKDDNCNGIADENFVGAQVTCGTGVCEAMGVEACIDGVISALCTPKKATSTTDATCDGLDDDCDGTEDEDTVPEAIACGTGACSIPGVATCLDGELLESCGSTPEPTQEVCDGLDNDCNGTADDGAVGVYYTATQGTISVPIRVFSGQTDVETFYKYETAYDFSSFTGFERVDRSTVVLHRAPNGVVSLVILHDSPLGTTGGVSMMKVEGLEKGVVVVEDDPAGGIDTYDLNKGIFYWNWANGTTDGTAIEDIGADACFTLTTVVSNGTNGYDIAWGTGDDQRIALGAVNKAVKICASVCCLPSASDECDGLDNDCDGESDEDAAVETITCGEGACAATGTRTCTNGGFEESCTPLAPKTDVDECDGIDNDCDGEIDEDAQVTLTKCGFGDCARTGISKCENGVLVDSCVPEEAASSEDLNCDGVDEDCDGEVDEDFEATAITCGVGACEKNGKLACEDGAIIEDCEPGSPAADDAKCDGKDNDCDGEVDEDYASEEIECGVGACIQVGISACVDGKEIEECEPLPAPEDMLDECDGIDIDCDGKVDEDHASIPTECGQGGCAAEGEWACEDGLIVDTCEEKAAAADDSKCDGVDNDCDGETDEEFTSKETTCGEGVCAAFGVTSCEDGVLIDSCVAGDPISPTDEDCNGVDEDCDGDADDDYPAIPTTCGVGGCAAEGAIDCVDGEVKDTCVEKAPAADDSKCDGIDNDCDDQVDEDAHPVEITCGNGPCIAVGIQTCVDGAPVDDCTPSEPAVFEDLTCDGIDEDCDGKVDEDFPVEVTACESADGCVGAGELTCKKGQLHDSCQPPVKQADDTLCDGIDNDCDGSVDEDFAPYAIECGEGVCRQGGFVQCQNGEVVENCAPLPSPAPVDAVCDGLDEDCDGEVDEDFATEISNCGYGVCAAQGETSCVDGKLIDTCEPGLAVAFVDDACDGLDVDCDGETDEDFVEEKAFCGVGACAATGAFECQAGVVVQVCEPGQPTDEACDRIDNDCDGYVDEGLASGNFAVTQGLKTEYASVVESGGEVAAFYDYNTETQSTNSEWAAENRSTFVLHRDPNGQLDLVIVNDSASSADGGHLVLNVVGFTQGAVAAGDDPDSPLDIFDVEGGYFEWTWEAGQTDGVAIGNVGDGLCITVIPSITEGIDGFDVAWGFAPHQRWSLDSTTESFTICSSMCVEEPPLPVCWDIGLTPGDAAADLCVPSDTCPNNPTDIDPNCDGIDDDCDGYDDDDFQGGEIECGVGACAVVGAVICEDGIAVESCTPGEPSPEVCDGIDNDCNGEVDDGLIPEPIECGIGPCLNVGERVCEGGQLVDQCEPFPAPAPVDATCDGFDEDCDGSVDEDVIPEPLLCGQGACMQAGIIECIEGMIVSMCEPGQPTDEVCDGLDNDCDGENDEDIFPAASTCGVGACGRTGVTYCEFGVTVDTCKPGFPATNDPTCDNVDDDCDGAADEDWLPPVEVCGGNPDKAQCVGGEIVADCEVCDGKDNDADSSIDEGANGRYFAVTQGNKTLAVVPVKGAQSVKNFYSYHTPVQWSSATGYEENDRGTLMLYEDATGKLSLVVMLDAAGSGTGGEGRLDIKGLTQGTVVVKDDAPGAADNYDEKRGQYRWKWNECCNDGMAVEDIPQDGCFTITPSRFKGLKGFDFVSGEAGEERIPLNDLTSPITICVAICCAPEPQGEVCDGADNDCDGEVDEGLLGKTLTVSVGATTLEVQALKTTQDAQSFYSYNTLNSASSATGLEAADTTVLAVHEDPTGAMSLMVLHDAPRSGSGGRMIMRVGGLTGAETVFIDDPNSKDDKFQKAAGVFVWEWFACCTDGAFISGLGHDFCLELKPEMMKGIKKFAIASGDGSVIPIPLPTAAQPLKICSQPYCIE
jgi:hypothetical protein